MNAEKQLAMERSIRAFIDKVNAENPDTMCGLIKPAFAECDSDELTLTMSYPVQHWERNPIGRMQGGVTSALLDFTAGCLAIYLSGAMAVTVSMQVSYLRPGPLEGEMLVKARCTKAGRSLIHVFAECWDAAAPGKTVATANVVYSA